MVPALHCVRKIEISSIFSIKRNKLEKKVSTHKLFKQNTQIFAQTSIFLRFLTRCILHEALKASETLAAKGCEIKVVDLFTIKPLNVEWIREQAASCNNKIVVVEDHYAQGGIGGAIAEALMEDQIRIKHLCVRDIPRSGPSAALMNMFKIDAEAIVEAVEGFQQ